MRKIIMILAVCGFITLNIGYAKAEENKKEVVEKTITGVVSGISYNFIAVMYGQDEKGETSLEMAFKVDKGVAIEHKSSLKEIKFGDTVSVTYEETTETSADGTKSSQRIAKAITFLRPAQNQPGGAENVSLESSQTPLAIKGVKEGE